MKISKRSVTACESCGCVDMTSTTPNVTSDVDQMTVTVQPTTVSPSITENKYQPVVDQLISAIDTLGSFAKDDPVARESIANLSVVIFDLKG